jgi:hypothetical protein
LGQVVTAPRTSDLDELVADEQRFAVVNTGLDSQGAARWDRIDRFLKRPRRCARRPLHNCTFFFSWVGQPLTPNLDAAQRRQETEGCHDRNPLTGVHAIFLD